MATSTNSLSLRVESLSKYPHYPESGHPHSVKDNCYLLSILAGLPDDFPWSFWDRLLPQTETTLNLLRQSNSTPTVSAYAHMHGNFDYNRMPLAPMGCPVQVHVKSKDRKTFDFHSEPGFYLFTSPDYYQVHKNIMTKTKAERLSDLVVFQ